MELAAEMELDYERFLSMTWAEFEWCQVGYNRRVERGFDYVRHLIAAEFNSSGFSKKTVKASDVIQLPHLDRPTLFRRIPRKKVDQLLKLLN